MDFKGLTVTQWLLAISSAIFASAMAVAAEAPRDSARARPYVAIDQTATVSDITIPLYLSNNDTDGTRVVVYEPPVVLKAEPLSSVEGGAAGRLAPITKVDEDGTLSVEFRWHVNDDLGETARLIGEQLSGPAGTEFQDVGMANINPLYAARAYFEIEEPDGTTTPSNTRLNQNFLARGWSSAHFNFQGREHAERVAAGLRRDFARYQIRFMYDFAGEIVDSCVARANSQQLQQLWRNRIIQPGEDSQGEDRPPAVNVSRHQAIRAAREMSVNVEFSTRCAADQGEERERLVQVLERRLERLLAQVQTPRTVVDWGQLDNLGGFDHRDLMPRCRNVRGSGQRVRDEHRDKTRTRGSEGPVRFLVRTGRLERRKRRALTVVRERGPRRPREPPEALGTTRDSDPMGR